MLAGSLGLLWYTYTDNPCRHVIEYDIGIFDDRFRITESEALGRIQSAEERWEDAAGQDLFSYVPGAEFKINFIFGEEQEKRYQADEISDSLDSTKDEISSTQQQYEQARADFQRKKSSYDSLLAQYNRDVEYWNSQGGAPENEFNKLEAQKKTLESRLAALETARKKVNRLAEASNNTINDYNSTVETFNSLYDSSYEFDAGNTDGTEINIYSYDSLGELETLLVHEFGHVLGIDHLDNPESVMHYLLNEDNSLGNLHSDDIEALSLSCNLD
tara:strand:- start:149 stop:967 length:819 start_codon:yes stop_codon:yes gene_type:complete